MTITPDQARELLDGATPGPWEHQAGYLPGDNRDGNVIMTGNLVLATYDGGYGGNPEWTNSLGNLPLVAAAPDMAETIAGMDEEWGVERRYRSGTETATVWFPTESDARREVNNPNRQNGNPRLVHRLVSAPEAIDGE